MKGLLKGLKYISSQIFAEEEEEEEDNDIQIGLPTDVKHVAHIGWDGPSANSPSWMDDFKSPAPGNSSTPSQSKGEASNKDIAQSQEENTSTKKSATKETQGKDLPGLPKSSRRQPSWDSSADSPNVSPSRKNKSSRRRQKQKESSSSPKDESSGTLSLPNIPKKSRRKKSKDENGTSRSKEKGSKHGSRHEFEDGSSKQHSEVNSSTSLASLKEDEVNAW